MDEWIASYTALPNLHPALVHFPIALVPLAALFDLLAAGWGRGRHWLSRAATSIWALAALATGLAFWAGREAADSLVGVGPQVQARVGTHSDWGLYSLWVVGLLAAFRLGLARWQPERRAALLVAGLSGIVASGFVLRTADLGGSLVYQHAVAVAVPEPRPEEPAPAQVPGTVDLGSPESRLQRRPDGVLEWRPIAGDQAALGTVLEPLAGREAVVAASASDPSAEGLPLEVTGPALLVLPGPYGDVQVDAEIDVSGFRGALGLAHHAQGIDETGLLRIEIPGGQIALLTLRSPAGTKVLDRSSLDVPAGPLRLGVYAAGRHLRGMLGEQTVVHGHEPALADGRVGLFLDGRGSVVVRSLTVTPIHH